MWVNNLTQSSMMKKHNNQKSAGFLHFFDFKQIAEGFQARYSYKCSTIFLQYLEWSREGL